MISKRGLYYYYDFIFQGKRYQASTRLTNKSAAQRVENLLREKLARAAAGIPDPETPVATPTLAEYIPIFLKWSKILHAHNTYVLHRSNCRALERHLGQRRLNEIARADVEAFMVARAGEAPVNVSEAPDGSRTVKLLPGTVSGPTVNRAVTTLKKLYYHAQGRYPQLGNPCRGVELLAETEVQRIVTDEEFQHYQAVAPRDLGHVAAIMRERGPRPQDIVTLTVPQVDFEANTMEFWPKPRPRSKLVAVPRAAQGKTLNSSRMIDMSPKVRKILEERVREARSIGSEYLFPMRDWRGELVVPGRPRNANSLNKPHRAAARKAKIDGRVRLYDLRHTFATVAIRQGVNLRVVQDMLGHSDPKITMRYTQRNDLVAQRAAFARIEPGLSPRWGAEGRKT